MPSQVSIVLTTYYGKSIPCINTNLSKAIDLLKSIGFKSVKQPDIYPPDKNPWQNIHHYALVCRK